MNIVRAFVDSVVCTVARGNIHGRLSGQLATHTSPFVTSWQSRLLGARLSAEQPRGHQRRGCVYLCCREKFKLAITCFKPGFPV